MILARRKIRILLIAIAAVGSAIGAATFYPIGMYFLAEAWPLIEGFHYLEKLDNAQGYYQLYGPWMMVLGGVTPVPLKILMFAGGNAALLSVVIKFQNICSIAQLIFFFVI